MLKAQLLPLRDEEYAAFQRRLMPTLAGEKILGVRTPALRKLARDLRGAPLAAAFLQQLPHDTFEENQLHAFLINDLKDFHEALTAVEAFLPYVDNWATCDQLRPKALAKDKAALLAAIQRYLADGRPYVIRFGLEMLMCHFMEADFDKRYLDLAAAVQSEEYYVKMMVAWYFATALTHQYDAALPFIEGRRLEKWTHNKAIQKAIESLQIPEERKNYLRLLKA